MPHHRTRTIMLAAVGLGVAAAGVVAGVSGYRSKAGELQAALIDGARRSAVALDGAERKQLTGTAADAALPAHATLKRRLGRLHAVQPDARLLCVLRRRAGDARLVYLADSSAAARRGGAIPGDDYAGTPSPALGQVIRTGQPTAEGPWRDDAGTWATAYALIGDASDDERDILRLEVDASEWGRSRWGAALQDAFLTWILLALPFGAFLVSRRQVEQREVIRNLSEAMEQSHSAIMIADLDGRIEYANRGLCRQLGYSRRELLGRDWRELRANAADDPLPAEILATVRAGRPWEGEWLNRRRDGTSYPVRGVVSPVKHGDGSLSCQVVVFDDVTEVKRREAELRDARDLAQAGDRAKGHFLATISHEVRTPLNGIVGFTSLLLETPLTAEQRDYVQTIRMSTEALIQLTGDILDFARIESGKLKLDALPHDPRECVEDALDLLAAKAAEKGIELLHHVDVNVPAAVLVDGGRLRQVLVNLIGNAVKFTERGEVEVQLRLLPSAGAAGSDGVLEFSVRDTGIGIAPAHHAKLFKPFSQVDDSSTRRYSGTGLGLAISHNLVRLMGGDISVQSSPGTGSVFTFTIAVPILAASPPERELGDMPVGLLAPPGALRRELVSLLRSWRARPVEGSRPEDVSEAECRAILMNVDLAAVAVLTAAPEPLSGVPPAKAIGLVPVSLPSDRRAHLRTHFHSLLNKPVHHDALFALLTDARADEGRSRPAPTQFGFRVLVVEDNRVNQRLMQRALETLGCTSGLSENGGAALAELTQRAAQYDLVLLDLHMPEVDGLTALKEIRVGAAGPRAQTMWIVALTADAREEQRTRALAAGINDYVTKPVRLADIEAALQRYRAERRGRQR